MECNSLKNGQCMVASEIAGEIAIASASTCAACQKDENPMTANKPTCGLAIVALHNAGHFDRKEHHYIVECAIHPVKGGPGTELERILSWAFKKSEGCDCDAHKSAMNVWGPDECEKRMRHRAVAAAAFAALTLFVARAYCRHAVTVPVCGLRT
jgi:hypothetical protein